jgi:hypothetical protein
MREFRPPVRPSLFRSVFSGVVALMLVVSAAAMLVLASSSNQVTYAIAGGTLMVDSGSHFDGARTIPLTLVHDRRVVALAGGRRTCGTVMAGYCTGRWTYPELGTVWQAGNCSSQGVLITTLDGDLPVVVTPPDPEAFVAGLDARSDLTIALPAADAAGLRIFLAAAAVFSLLMAALLVSLLLLGPGRMVYGVGEGRLEVRTLFGRRSWSLHGLRARPHVPRVTLRLAGTAAPGYYTGLYRVDGSNTRIYATDLKSGVLVEGPARVYLSPENVAGFLDALRAAGAEVQAA